MRCIFGILWLGCISWIFGWVASLGYFGWVASVGYLVGLHLWDTLAGLHPWDTLVGWHLWDSLVGLHLSDTLVWCISRILWLGCISGILWLGCISKRLIYIQMKSFELIQVFMKCRVWGLIKNLPGLARIFELFITAVHCFILFQKWSFCWFRHKWNQGLF